MHGDIIVSRWYGVFTSGQVDKLIGEVEALEDASPLGLDRITDVTSVERFDIGFPTLYALAERRKKRRFSRSIKSAIVVREPAQVGLARMFKTLNDHPQIEIRLVLSIQEARDWFAAGASGSDPPATESGH